MGIRLAWYKNGGKNINFKGASEKNIFFGLEYFSSNLPGVPENVKSQYEVDTSKIVWTGHSMYINVSIKRK